MSEEDEGGGESEELDDCLGSVGPYTAYVGKKLAHVSGLIEAVPLVKEVAHYPPNHVREVDGEDLFDRSGFIRQGEKWVGVENLGDYVTVTHKPPDRDAPVRCIYEVRVRRSEAGLEVRRRVLTIQTDLISPPASPLTAEWVMQNRDRIIEQAAPLVRTFFPIHEGVGFNLAASDPVPRAFPGRGTMHMRTSIQARFVVDHESAIGRPPEVKRRVQLLGPDGRPIRSR